MKSKYEIACLILAGGKSERAEMNKALRRFENQYWINYLISHYYNFGVKQIYIGLAHQPEKILSILDIRLITANAINPNPQDGQFSTLRETLLRAVKDDWKRILITPIDSAAPDYTTLKKMLTSSKPIVKPVYQQKSGHPVLIDKSVCNDIVEEKHSDARLDLFLHTYNADLIARIETNDKHIITNLNNITAWEEFKSKSK